MYIIRICKIQSLTIPRILPLTPFIPDFYMCHKLSRSRIVMKCRDWSTLAQNSHQYSGPQAELSFRLGSTSNSVNSSSNFVPALSEKLNFVGKYTSITEFKDISRVLISFLCLFSIFLTQLVTWILSFLPSNSYHFNICRSYNAHPWHPLPVFDVFYCNLNGNLH